VALADAPRTLAGYASDVGLYGSLMQDALESVPALAWPESVRTYHAMRFDPRLTATVNAYMLPLRSACYAVDPAGCRDEVVQLIADDLGISILGADNKPGPARRRGVNFREYLRVALLSLIYGHMPFAIGGEVRASAGGPMRWRLNELSERMPSTITQILTDKAGRLTGIQQFGDDPAIPVDSLVWTAHEREGANWQGRSMLRPAYGAWLIKHEMWRVMATANRRFGAGTPIVEAPPGATDAQIKDAARLAQSMRVGDQGGAGLPNGYTAKLMGIVGGVPDTLGFVRYLDQQMAEMALAGVLSLDASPNGSRALGETLIGLLEMSWAAVATEITTPLTSLAIRMVDWNWGEDEPAPNIVATDIARPEVTTESIVALVGAGAITPDPTLEGWLRERMDMPEADPVPEPAVDPTVAPPGAAPAPDPANATPQELANIIQKIYLGTGVVVSATEAREILNRAGAGLNPNEDPAPTPPAPPAPPAPSDPNAPPVDPNAPPPPPPAKPAPAPAAPAPVGAPA
jgi:hypothetical protein